MNNKLYSLIISSVEGSNENLKTIPYKNQVIWEKLYKNISNLEILGISIFDFHLMYFIIAIFLLLTGIFGIISLMWSKP